MSSRTSPRALAPRRARSRLLAVGLALAVAVPLLAGAAPPQGGMATPTAAADTHRTQSARSTQADQTAQTARTAQDETCAVKSKPAGKVLQGYWENWDGAANGVHPPFGWTPITDTRIRDHGYNVINAAFPVIRSDGTVLWEDGMDSTVKVATPAEMCQAKADGATIHSHSIPRATPGTSSHVSRTRTIGASRRT